MHTLVHTPIIDKRFMLHYKSHSLQISVSTLVRAVDATPAKCRQLTFWRFSLFTFTRTRLYRLQQNANRVAWSFPRLLSHLLLPNFMNGSMLFTLDIGCVDPTTIVFTYQVNRLFWDCFDYEGNNWRHAWLWCPLFHISLWNGTRIKWKHKGGLMVREFWAKQLTMYC